MDIFHAMNLCKRNFNTSHFRIRTLSLLQYIFSIGSLRPAKPSVLAPTGGIDKGFAFSDVGASDPERLMLILATRKKYFSFMN